MKRTLLALVIIASATACAKRPDAIAPVAMAGAFDGISCASARSLLNSENANLEALSAQQNSAADGDALGVFLIGLPLGSVSGGDNEGEIAASKGKILALENRLLRC